MLPKNMKVIEGVRFGEERALYGSRELHLKSCSFAGAEDGESALKESARILVEDTLCDLRYPFWHDEEIEIADSHMTEKCRAALWYSKEVSIRDSKLHGTKAVRECENISVRNCDINSEEFGWFCHGLEFSNTTAQGAYFLLRSSDIRITGLKFGGKYSFQYVSDVTVEDSELDTKDAFWHAKNVTVKNSTVKGEYLGWYSDGLTLIDCKIIGTQPLCYCKNLRLINCEMIDTDLAFERSEVEATVTTVIDSIKNPYAGLITAPDAKEIILDDPKAICKINLTQKG